MSCKWCHNPETLSLNPQLEYFPEKCIGCGACVSACPKGAHTVSDGGVHAFNRALCQNCGNCAKECYAEALVLVGTETTAEEALAEVLQDKPYYDSSGGGITLSGGECFLQPEFVRELLEKSRAAGLHTAVESNMAHPWDLLEPLLPLVDLVMADLKAFDGDVHKKWTGVPNARIMENLRLLAGTGKPLILRTPVIPGVNDSEKEIAAIASFAATLPNLLYYELLPYNPMGGDKYSRLDMKNEMTGVKKPSKDFMRSLAKVARAAGIKVAMEEDVA